MSNICQVCGGKLWVPWEPYLWRETGVLGNPGAEAPLITDGGAFIVYCEDCKSEFAVKVVFVDILCYYNTQTGEGKNAFVHEEKLDGS